MNEQAARSTKFVFLHLLCGKKQTAEIAAKLLKNLRTSKLHVLQNSYFYIFSAERSKQQRFSKVA